MNMQGDNLQGFTILNIKFPKQTACLEAGKLSSPCRHYLQTSKVLKYDFFY